jgi:hypothetical protein
VNKFLIACFFLLSCVVNANERDLIEAYLDVACVDPCRKLDGKVVDLTPKFNHARNILLNNHDDGNLGMLPEWKLVIGTVFQVCDDGLLIRRYATDDWLNKGDSELVFVKNEHDQKWAVDNKPVAFYAVEDGRYSYTSTQGARKTVAAFNCGEKCTKEEASEVRKAQPKIVSAEKIAEVNSAFVKAKAGQGFYQIVLAEHFRDGDGVERNLVLG